MKTEEIVEEYKDYLKNDDLKGFYDELSEQLEIDVNDIGAVTQYFYEKGVDPLEYVNKIPACFLCGTDIESFTIPSHIKEIGDGAFRGCENLESIEIPDGVTEIGDCAFWCCNNLKSIKLPDSLEKIGSDAFANCKNLMDINIPKNLKNVHKWAFYECPDKTVDKFREFIK